MSLAIPLTAQQIDAANSIYERLPQWKASDSALTRLASRFPDFDTESVLLKVVAINSLYSTRILAVDRMTRHVKGIIDQTDLSTKGIELVEELAALPAAAGHRKLNHTAFAAKFAHFFIDSERFPILDSHAERMLSCHLRRRDRVRDEAHRYRAFVANFHTLKGLAGYNGPTREFDRYLWIAGQYRVWRKKLKEKINGELAALFSERSRAVMDNLDTLMPPGVFD